MNIILMYIQLILVPYANEWFQCKHYWDPKCVHSSLKLEIYQGPEDDRVIVRNM